MTLLEMIMTERHASYLASHVLIRNLIRLSDHAGFVLII